MDPMSFTTSLAAGQILAQQLKTGGVHTPAFGPPRHSTIPEKISELKGEMAGGSLPTCPMIYAIIADMAIVGIPNAPPPQWREEAGQQQQFGYRHDVPPLPALVPLSLTDLYLKVECQISTAFVTVQGTWVLDCLRSGAICDCLLAVPMDHQGTVAGVEIDLGNRRLYTTIVVPRDEAASYGAKGSPMTNVDDPGTYNPDLFRLRVPQVVSGTRLSLKITWFQAMLFSDGLYTVRVPLILPDYVVPLETELASIVKLTCSINTGTPHPVVVGQFNNTMKETLREDGRVSLVSGGKDTWGDWKNSDFIASYQVWSDKILPNLLVQDPIPGESDPRGTFCLSIAPPDPKHVKAFKRAVVFLLDRSGSMYGKPMEDACQALLFGLSSLQPEDSFNIIVFDHAQLTFSSQLVHATAPILGHAQEWVTTNCEARGGTDILAPLQAAFQLLQMNLDAVPYIFLITDGAVVDERKICRLIQAAVTSRGGKAPRISTFGIG